MDARHFKIGDRVYIIGGDVYWWMITSFDGPDVAILERRNERTDQHETCVRRVGELAMARLRES